MIIEFPVWTSLGTAFSIADMAYHIARENQQLGQFGEGEIRMKLSTGEFLATDLCWTDGMTDWKPLGQVLGQSGAVPPVVTEVNPYAPPTVEQSYRPVERYASAPLATLGQRLGAALLDGLAGFVAVLPMVVSIVTEGVTSEGEMKEPNMMLLGLTGVLFLTLLIINLIFLVKRGQTIGKRIVGIRIVGLENDSNPGGVKTVLLRGIVNGIIGALPLIGPLYSIADILFIFGQERRCLHDLIAGTRVVQGQPEAS